MRTLLFLFFLQSFSVFAQADSLVLLTKNFKFQDGIFLSLEDFQSNKASLSWDTVYAKLYTNPKRLVTTVDSISIGNELINDKIWGFSLGGIPYINLRKKNSAGLDVYAGLKVRGNICYFIVDEIKEEVQTIKAYNPRTGVPFREGDVVTKKEVEHSFMMSFETGEIKAFTVEDFLPWIEKDQKLVKQSNT